MVKERFTQSSTLYAADQLIKGVLTASNKVVFALAAFITIPGLQGLVKFLGTVVRISLTYMDEVILAHSFRTKSDNVWASSGTALVLDAQNYKTFLKKSALHMILVMCRH